MSDSPKSSFDYLKKYTFNQNSINLTLVLLFKNNKNSLHNRMKAYWQAFNEKNQMKRNTLKGTQFSCPLNLRVSNKQAIKNQCPLLKWKLFKNHCKTTSICHHIVG